MLDEYWFALLLRKNSKIFRLMIMKNETAYFCSQSLFILRIPMDLQPLTYVGIKKQTFNKTFILSNDTKLFSKDKCNFHQLNGNFSRKKNFIKKKIHNLHFFERSCSFV